MATGKWLGITVAIVAIFVVLWIEAPSAAVILIVPVCWGGIWIGGRAAFRHWKQQPFLQQAQHLSDICNVEYYRRVSASQLEDWIQAVLTAHGSALLGDPVLGRSRVQGYAWLNGKKTVLDMRLEHPLTEDELKSIYNQKNKCKADTVLVFSPFVRAPKNDYPGLEILAGKELLAWLSVLREVRPKNIGKFSRRTCPCGSAQVQHVSRGGEPLLTCSRYPDCQKVQRPGFGRIASAATV